MSDNGKRGAVGHFILELYLGGCHELGFTLIRDKEPPKNRVGAWDAIGVSKEMGGLQILSLRHLEDLKSAVCVVREPLEQSKKLE